jgi:hypothetical protein
MRSLLVMWNPYPQAPEVSIVRTDTCKFNRAHVESLIMTVRIEYSERDGSGQEIRPESVLAVDDVPFGMRGIDPGNAQVEELAQVAEELTLSPGRYRHGSW